MYTLNICCLSGVHLCFPGVEHPTTTRHARPLPGLLFLRRLVRLGVLQEDSVPFELSHGPLAFPLHLTLELFEFSLFGILNKQNKTKHARKRMAGCICHGRLLHITRNI